MRCKDESWLMHDGQSRRAARRKDDRMKLASYKKEVIETELHRLFLISLNPFEHHQKPLPLYTHIMSQEFNIPKTQKAAVLHSCATPIQFETIPVLHPGRDQVLVKIHATGVCHTDLHALNGDWSSPPKLPLIGGHEGAGHVVEVGEDVHDLKIGDRVGIVWLHWACGSCEYCMKGYENLCPKQLNSGYSVDGPFQQYALAKASHVARIPEGLDMEQVAPILCAGVTAYKGLKETNVKPGEFCAIVGAGGGLGHLAVQYAKAMGMIVIGIDGGDEKANLVKSLGADHFVDFTKEDVSTEVKRITGGGAHGILVVAASPKPMSESIHYIRRRGTITCVGLPGGAMELPIFNVVSNGIIIRGTMVGTRQDLEEALGFVARGQVKSIVQVMKLEDLNKVFDLMRKGDIVGRIVLKIDQ